jgi:hypothetical protein
MSRFRRITLAVAAATAALACAIPTSASAISINSTAGNGTYNVIGVWTWFDMTRPGSTSTFGAMCYHYGTPKYGYGRGLATGQAQTPFVPPFTAVDGDCGLQDDANPSGAPAVRTDMAGAFMLTLTGLKAGQNPLSPQRYYDGKLWLHSYSRLEFRPAKLPGCTVTVAGPQSVDIDSGTGSIWVDDDQDVIVLEVLDAEFTATKTAACPSRIGDRVTIYQPFGAAWYLNGVTVTP